MTLPDIIEFNCGHKVTRVEIDCPRCAKAELAKLRAVAEQAGKAMDRLQNIASVAKWQCPEDVDEWNAAFVESEAARAALKSAGLLREEA